MKRLLVLSMLASCLSGCFLSNPYEVKRTENEVAAAQAVLDSLKESIKDLPLLQERARELEERKRVLKKRIARIKASKSGDRRGNPTH